MLKKDKIFVFLVVLFSVILLFSVSSFATDDSYTFTGPDYNTYTVPALPDDGFDHFILVFNSTWNRFEFFNFSGSLSITKFGTGGLIFTFDDSKSYTYYQLDDNSWVKYGSSGSYSYDSASVFSACTDLLSYIDEMNTVKSAEEGSDNSSFFYNAPTVVTDGTLVEIIQETPLTGVLQEIVEILPIVLVTIVGLIGLRKALQMLLAVLHRS